MKRLILFISIALLASLSIGQSSLPKKVNDSLWKVWKSNKQHDTNKLKAMNMLSWDGYLFTMPDSAFYFAELQYKFAEKKGFKKHMTTALSTQGVSFAIRGDYDKAIFYFDKGLKINEEIGDKKGISVSLNNLGNIYRNQGDYPKALNYFMKSLKIDEELKNIKGTAASLNNIGSIYYDQGNFSQAINFLTKSLKIKEKTGNKQGAASSLANIGNIYKDQGDFNQALNYYTKALKINTEINDKGGIAATYSSIGNIYKEQKKFKEALSYYDKSLKIQEAIGDKEGIATSYSNIGSIYDDEKKDDKALEYYEKGLKIDEETGNKQGVSLALNDIGKIYLKKGIYQKALNYSQRSLVLAKEIGSATAEKNAAEALWKVYRKLGKYQNSLEMYELFISARDSILSEESQREVLKQGFKYDYEKKAAADSVKSSEEKKVKDAQIAQQKAEISAKRNQQFMLFGGLVLVAIFAVFIFNRFKVTQKQKNIIEIQKVEVEQQRDEINEKNQLITESIEYAKTIQEAIITSHQTFKDIFADMFILFKPKDIVSGDFYWGYKSKSNKVFWAAADCTGHGVPGAFMTMIGTSLLNEIIIEKEIEDTNQILDELRNSIIATMNKNISIESDEKIRNGMDISLCCWDLTTNELSFSGANNPLFIYRNGELIEFKPDKQPIGLYKRMTPFTKQSIHLLKGDKIYSFSDGYPDQMNEEESRLKIANFKTLILDTAKIKTAEQKIIFEATYEKWKGNYDQIDDVVLIGVEI